MEQTNKTLDVGKNLYDYMDVDTTRADLIKYFKSKIIPNFPEETELSTEKLIKAAKFFYLLEDMNIHTCPILVNLRERSTIV